MITDKQNNDLLKEVTDEEIKGALFQMHPDKSPGPDGMTPAFFQKHWAVLGSDIVSMVKEFFVQGRMRNNLNETNVVLIPKKKSPTKMGELRPISLCNVLAKVITKVLANRMKEVLEGCISDNQSAFIPGRLISDNVMISYEVMHYLKGRRRGKEGYMALKLDMSKAYDMIEWDYLRAILRKMGFAERLVQLVLQCVTSVSYRIIHGQNNMGPIQPRRGIRQGDPLSPYLFILCAEGLSALIRRNEERKWISGIKVCNKAPSITHMLFADDSYMYCKASEEEAFRVLNMLQVFQNASGQKVNKAKSSVFFSMNTSTECCTKVCEALQMVEADERSTYLGLSNTMGRNKSITLGFLKDKVNKRVASWDGKLISKGGKEALIKSVAQMLPSYAMSVFLLPLGITKDIERSMALYWWCSQPNKEKGIHWMGWDRMSHHKAAGGMGFRNLRDFNLDILGKQGWRFLIKPESLVSKMFKARYFPSTNFLDSGLGNNPSFVWRSVWEANELVKAGARWLIGSGHHIDIINQPWLLKEQNPCVTTISPTLQQNKVAGLMLMEHKSWDNDIIEDLFNDRDQQCIKNITLRSDIEEYKLFWKFEESGNYSVKSAYRFLQVQKGLWHTDYNDSLWKRMWRLKDPAKVLNLVCRALTGCLPTNSILQQKYVPVMGCCPVCDGGE